MTTPTKPATPATLATFAPGARVALTTMARTKDPTKFPSDTYVPAPDGEGVFLGFDTEGEGGDMTVMALVGRDDGTVGTKPLEWVRFIRPEPESPATGLKVALKWSVVKPPSDKCRHHHCTADTPFGQFVLTWKNHKDSAPIDCDVTPWGEYEGPWAELNEAKAACEAEFNRRISETIATPAP